MCPQPEAQGRHLLSDSPGPLFTFSSPLFTFTFLKVLSLSGDLTNTSWHGEVRCEAGGRQVGSGAALSDLE